MPRRGQFATYEPGVYEGVTHVEFFTKDQHGNLIFKAKDRGGRPELVAYYRIWMGEEQGPPAPSNRAMSLCWFAPLVATRHNFPPRMPRPFCLSLNS